MGGVFIEIDGQKVKTDEKPISNLGIKVFTRDNIKLFDN